MYSNSELSWEKVEKLADEIVFKVTGRHLNDKEAAVLKGACEGKSYDEIGKDRGLTGGHVSKDVGSPLWKILSEGTQEDVSKTNFIQALLRYKERQASSLNDASSPETTPIQRERANILELPEGLVPLDSHFYIERRNVESLCNNIIMNPGELIRIRAPQKMGKTLLLGNLLDYARQQGYQTAKLDLKLADSNADSNTLTCLNTFTQWLCDEVLNNLDPQPNVEEYWQALNKVNGNLTRFFQNYLLSNIESPLVLAIDSFEVLFKYKDIFSEFCSNLRVWHDNAKSGDRVGKIWRKLRVVLVYSTETYPDLDTNHSPFNAGIPIELPDFNFSEVTTLAKLYELDEQLGENGLSQLMGLVGGHPYFIHQAFANLKNQQMTLEQLLSLAPTEQGIYSNFLRQQLWILQHNPQLESAYKKVVMANEPVRLDTEVAFKLHSMGLVKFSRNDCIRSYDLHRQYFFEHLG